MKRVISLGFGVLGVIFCSIGVFLAFNESPYTYSVIAIGLSFASICNIILIMDRR